MASSKWSAEPPQEIALAIPGERTRLDKMRNFLGTPVKPPQKIALASTGERTLPNKTRDFPGTPVKTPGNGAHCAE